MISELAGKRETLVAYLMNGETYVLVDASQPGVNVPGEQVGNENLILKFSYKYRPADLELSGWGITQTLHFPSGFHSVRVPWSAVYAARAVTGDVEAWPKPPPAPELVKRRGHLGVVH